MLENPYNEDNKMQIKTLPISIISSTVFILKTP